MLGLKLIHVSKKVHWYENVLIWIQTILQIAVIVVKDLLPLQITFMRGIFRYQQLS